MVERLICCNVIHCLPMFQFECCGVTNSSDWGVNNPTKFSGGDLPDSCCVTETIDCGKKSKGSPMQDQVCIYTGNRRKVSCSGSMERYRKVTLHGSTTIHSCVADKHSGLAHHFFEPTCAHAWWAHSHRFASVCDWTKNPTRKKIISQKVL